jgi:carotenoid 1,2-hydratase
LTYDVQVGSGPSLGHAYRIGRRGDFDVIDGLEKVDLGRSFWGLRRSARADRGASVGIRRSLEDGPFYSRALIDSTLAGRQVVAMHEHLSGERLTKGWVRYLTRHRMRSE